MTKKKPLLKYSPHLISPKSLKGNSHHVYNPCACVGKEVGLASEETLSYSSILFHESKATLQLRKKKWCTFSSLT